MIISDISSLVVEMEVSDDILISNCDWDPCYLQEIFREEFINFSDHWNCHISDEDLNIEMDKIERYCPITEDISLEDEVLCNAVEKIEDE